MISSISFASASVFDNGYNVSTGGEYAHNGAYKYKLGDVIDGFLILEHEERKILIKCNECGAILSRYAGSLKRNGIKCKCKIKNKKSTKKRNRCLITHNGRTQTVQEWSSELDIPVPTIRSRYQKGQPIDKALKTPITTKKCGTCENKFTPKYNNQKYCCKQCADESYKVNKETKKCQNCNKGFVLKRTLCGNYKGMFCSVECRINFQKNSNDE